MPGPNRVETQSIRNFGVIPGSGGVPRQAGLLLYVRAMPGTSSKLPTVVVVDDVADLRSVVRSRLRLSGRFEVVGEGQDGREAVDLVAEHRPDLLLMDVSMPGVDGLQALPEARAASPTTRVVMFSGFDEHGLADRARALGAAAYLQKSLTLDTLVDDLLEVLRDPSSTVLVPPPGASSDGVPEEGPVLAEHQERFREVFEDAAIGMATVTLSGRIVRSNRHLAGLLQRPAAELLGSAYAEVVTGVDVEGLIRTIVVDGHDDARAEHTVPGRPGVLLQSTLTPVLSAEREPLYLFLQVQDVTGQREAEAGLRESEQRFRLMVETVQDYAIFMLDPDGRIASWNAGAERHKGYTAEEAVGQHFRMFYPPEVRERRHPEHELQLALAHGRYEEEGWRLRKDGSRFWAQVTITAVRRPDGSHLGFAKVTRDVTERRRLLQEQEAAAEALAAANERLQQVADEQAQFVAVTAHELRGPVGTMAMSAETLRRHWADLEAGERDEFLQAMASSANQLNRLLADLLTASRLQASALEIRSGAVPVWRHLEELASVHRKAHPQSVVHLEGDEGAIVHADPGRLTQAMENLLGNALRHGRPPVRVRVVSHPATVDIEVRDAGDGVPATMRQRLFDRFATSGHGGGTGLGLHIVRELARAQGGDAAYRPADGAFVLTLPRAEETP